MSLPSIAVLSAVWNEAEHIEEMVASLQAQTHPDWSVYFVDDGSTDDTAQIIQRLAAEDNRVKFVAKHEHRGKVAAFNAAFAASSEDLICLLAGDDKLPANSLELRCQALSDADPHADMVAVWGKLKTFSDNPKEDGIIMPRGEAPSRSGAAGAITRVLAEKIFPIPEQLPNEDAWIQACCKGLATKEKALTDIIANYRIHSGNTSPRHLTYEEFLKKQALRGKVWQLLLEEPRLEFDEETRLNLERSRQMEEARARQSLLGILKVPGVPLLRKAAVAWKGNKILYRIRWSNYRLFNGWLKA
ncbi:MAG: glycosyltransferase [Actinomycetaceae bacterium]|nr:glycosyltransferase [Actinomycetaceae bacterium]